MTPGISARRMADFLLVHGSCHGAWCWEAVIPPLEALGHSARAIDLPGHGADATPLENVTLDAYAEAIAAACGPATVLVGHSMGGYAITAAARLVPARIARLVYLCAYVPREGLSLADMRRLAPSQPLLPAIRMRADGLGFTVDPEMARGIFYNDCDDETAARAISRLCPQAVAPTNIAFRGTAAQRALPRRYIRCLDDRTIPPAFQVTLTEDWPPGHVQEMTCGHSPFLSRPDELVERLVRAVED
jgi:pimeloyl-ACP methyl ester carboxylesterase